MENNRFTYLFERHFAKEMTEEEKISFFFLVNQSKYDDQLKQLIESRLEHFEHQTNPFTQDAEERMLTTILQSDKSASEPDFKVLPLRRLWSRILVAASIVMMIGIGLYIYQLKQITEASIAPGKQSATLTLADGRKIILSDATAGRLAQEEGVTISKTADGQIVYEIKGAADANLVNRLTTAKGETYQVKLPDGTLVALNAASSLKYTTAMVSNGQRVVELTGEGYFEVAKDKAHPFIVKTSGQEIKVLGTHFNVNAYEDEETLRTTLLEGSVQVSFQGHKSVLKPGEQAIVKNNNIHVADADVEAAVAWKNGEFVFTGQSITEVMNILSRWYNVEVEFKGPKTNERFESSLPKDKDITEVLELLELTNTVHFKIEGRKIIVSK